MRCLSILILVFVCSTSQTEAAEPAYRHPVAITLDSKQTHLLTANSKSGSLTVVELKTGNVRETSIGGEPRDLMPLKENRFLVTDFAQHQVVEVELQDDASLKVLSRTSVDQYPQKIACTPDQKQFFVSSLWSRRISCLTPKESTPGFQKTTSIDLHFAPRELALLSVEPDNDQSGIKADSFRLLVGDHFGGQLAVIDCQKKEIEFEHRTTAHNIRGLGLANGGKTILIANQMLNELAHTSRNDIHWGLLMSNDLRWIQKDAFFKTRNELYKSSHMHPLGKENQAAGDPGGLAVAPDQTVLVTISGTNELAIGKEDDFWLKRIQVGNHPVAVAVDSSSKFAYVANAYDDSVSIVDIPQQKVSGRISLGPRRELSRIERGEQFFHDASLSHDGWMSCQSCHTDGHTNGGLNDNFTDGSFGAPKRVLSLLGKRDTEPLAWDGKTKSFEDQVEKSITSTMQSKDSPDEKTVKLIADYVRSLPPPPSLAKARGQLNASTIESGKKIFKEFGCVQCHQPPTFTTPDTYNVGLKDEFNETHFNPPSLLGVSQRTRFFHDGRVPTLREVLFKVRHKIPSGAEADQLELLLNYLQSL